MDRAAPYQPGDRVVVRTDGVAREAVVSMLVETSALDEGRRWRLLCRWVNEPEGTVEGPLYCGDDGYGQDIQPAQGGRTAGQGAPSNTPASQQ